MKTIRSALPAAAVLLAACDPGAPPPTPEEEARIKATGTEIAARLVQTLGTQMKAALESGGPVAAVTVCQTAAQPLTDSVTAATPDISVRRTSLRVRNPANAPDSVDRTVLEEFAATPVDQLPHERIKWAPDSARYYKPLLMQDLCTQCHGDPATFAPALRTLLQTAYPDDQATGFAVGDLRGVIRVDYQRSDPETDAHAP